MEGDEVQAYYALGQERDRLEAGLGELEFVRTIELIARTLPEPPCTVADIGGGPGRYVDWLVDGGYRVVHRDIVDDHVDQVARRHQSNRMVETAVGDARQLDLADQSVDAVFLLGPLYHLNDPQDRAQVLGEAHRIVRRGGYVYAAAISRWALRIQALLVERAYQSVDQALSLATEAEQSGVIAPLRVGGFTAYTHTPHELKAEIEASPLAFEQMLAIEGIAAAFTDDDVAERLDDPQDRAALLESIRALEAVPELLGASSHLLAVARRTH